MRGKDALLCAYSVRCGALSRDCATAQVRCYNCESGTLLGMLTGHKHPVHSLSFDATGRVMLTASVDSALIWSVHDWSKLRTLGCGAGIVQVRVREP
jgi:WD40 repeat protein